MAFRTDTGACRREIMLEQPGRRCDLVRHAGGRAGAARRVRWPAEAPLLIAPAINTATNGVRRQDSGVASALVNTMQQVGGSIGTAALSTIALTAAAGDLAAHRTAHSRSGASRPSR